MTTRKLLPATIGAILAGGMAAAQADVTVFGHLDNAIVKHDGPAKTFGSSDDDTNFVCTTCSIGFKGKEDLGNGLKAIFKLDFQFDMNKRNTGKASAKKKGGLVTTPTTPTGTLTTFTTASVVTSVSDTSSITDRDQWFGLAGNFGQVRIGTISTVYKSHGSMIDPIYRTVVQQRSIGLQSNMHTGAGEEGQGRATNTARYDSPSWNGLKFGATFTLDSDDSAKKEDDNPYGAGISYENGGILVFADYMTNNTGGDDEAYKVGGKYTLNNFAVFGQYEFDKGLISSKGADTSGDDADVWMIGGSYTMGNNMITAAYGQQDDGSGGSTVTESTQYEIVGVHKLSKRTSLYGGYALIDPDKGGDTKLYTGGMKLKF